MTGHGPAEPARGPALCRGLVVVETPAGLVIEGGPHRMLLGGGPTRTPLAELLRSLDGQRTPQALADRLPMTSEQVRQTLDLLDDWGLLEHGATPAGEARPAVPMDSVLFHSRTVASTGGHRSADALLDTLAGCRVLLDAAEPLASELADDLLASGVGAVSTSGEGAAPPIGDLVVVLDEAAGKAPPEDRAPLEDRVRTALPSGVPVLRVAHTGTAVEVGPLFWPERQTACVACFRRDRAATDTSGSGADAAERGLLVSLATTEVLAVLARTTAARTLNAVVRTEVPNLDTEHLLFTPDPCCARCGESSDRPECGTAKVTGEVEVTDADADEIADTGEVAVADTGAVTGEVAVAPEVENHAAPAGVAAEVEAYEWYHGAPPVEFTPAPRTLAPVRARQRRARQRRTTLPTSPALTLPAAPEGSSPSAPTGGADAPARGLSALAGLLSHTAGSHRVGSAAADGTHHTPPGSGHASVLAYLVTDPAPADAGVPGQVFRYDDTEHRLLSARADTVEWRRAVGVPGTGPETLRAAIVLVADAGALHEEFGERAWRLALLDAGVAATQLVVTAGAYGLPTRPGLCWTEELPTLLELDPAREAVAAVTGLTANPWTGDRTKERTEKWTEERPKGVST